MRCSVIALGLLVMVVGTGCGPKYMRKVEGPGLSAPPSGKALVNFMRPSNWGGGQDLKVFDGYDLIGNVKGKCRFQYVCDPGEHFFIARAERVSAIKADLAADKVYDVVVNIAMGVWTANVTMEPITADHPKRDEIPEWEERAQLYELDPDSGIGSFEDWSRGMVEDVKRDFDGGEKTHRTRILSPHDHR